MHIFHGHSIITSYYICTETKYIYSRILFLYPWSIGAIFLDQVLQQQNNDHFPPHTTVKNEEYITFFQVFCLHVVTLFSKNHQVKITPIILFFKELAKCRPIFISGINKRKAYKNALLP
jgi:hypothetical protein